MTIHPGPERTNKTHTHAVVKFIKLFKPASVKTLKKHEKKMVMSNACRKKYFFFEIFEFGERHLQMGLLSNWISFFFFIYVWYLILVCLVYAFFLSLFWPQAVLTHWEMYKDTANEFINAVRRIARLIVMLSAHSKWIYSIVLHTYNIKNSSPNNWNIHFV